MSQQPETFADGVTLGLWLESMARPQLRRWAKSGDGRVRLQATVLTTLIESRVASRDWAGLGEVCDAWTAAVEAVLLPEVPVEENGQGELAAT